MKRFYLILFLLIFTGCKKSKLADVNLQTSEYINRPFKKNKVDRGYLIAFYDLTEFEPENQAYLFNPKYSALINNDTYLMKYADNFKDKTFSLKTLNKKAKQKVQLLLDSIYALQKKYRNIPNPPLFLRLKMKLNIGTHLDYLSVLDQYYSNLPLLIPEESAYISSRYGHRCREILSVKPIKKGRKSKKMDFKAKKLGLFSRTRFCKNHYGIDLKSCNTDIYASGGGVVCSIQKAADFGNNIIIDHGNNIKTRYAHLDKMLVKVGEQVARGQKIGIQGNSGRSTGPHLHFEIIVNNIRINPEEFIKFLSIFEYRR